MAKVGEVTRESTAKVAAYIGVAGGSSIPALIMAHTIKGEPVIGCRDTDKRFVLPWSHIIALAETAGVFEPWPPGDPAPAPVDE